MTKILKLADLSENVSADHILFSMVRVENDARSLNLAKALLKRGDSVVLVGLESENIDSLFPENATITILTTDDLSKARAYQLWWNFHNNVFKQKKWLKARFWWALDIYVLPISFLITKWKGGKILYDSREIYSDLGENAKHPLKSLFLKWIETVFSREVDKVYTSGKMDSEYIRDLYKITEPDVILNVPEFVEIEPNQKLRKTFSIPESSKIVLYQGLVGPGRGLKQSIEAIKLVPEVHLVIMGNGIWLDELKNYAKSLNVESRVHFTGWVSYTTLLDWTVSADIGLVVIESYTKSLEFAFPNKLFEYAMAKLPVIASDLPQVKIVVEMNKSGLLVSSKVNSKEIAVQIQKMLVPENYEKFKKGAENVRLQFNWNVEAHKISTFITELEA